MAALIIRKLFSALIVIWLAVTLAFCALRVLPGDAIQTQFAQSGAPPAVIEARREALGLDQPLPVQYLDYLLGLLRGDLGVSLYGGLTVTETLLLRLPATIELAGLSLLLALILGIVLGTLGGINSGLLSSGARLLVDLSISVPVYWTGTVVLFVIAAQFGIRNNLMLPVLVLGFHVSGAIARGIQVNLRDTAKAGYIRAARGRGLPEHWIIRRHMLRVALLPVIPIIALQAGFLFSGTVITESIFQRPGMGLMLWDAVLQRNYPLVQGAVIVIALVYVSVNTLADIVLRLLDPRLSAI